MLKVYNTMTKEKEEFQPMEGKKVKMFVCGPTVYDYPHIGHAKTYVANDVIARYLRYAGYDLTYVQNITDLDDKIIQRANEQGISPKELADRFTREYYTDMEALNVTSVDKYAPATDYIKEIIEQAQGLLEKGYAYEAEDGIYYDLTKFEGYGKLSKRKAVTELTGEEGVSRIDVSEHKKNVGDFCIWKKSKEGEPWWDSPWGKGRPGWHIEDTAISISTFGPQYDIHGGGEDLIFPHHEAEIAIAEAFTGIEPFVKYWLHVAFLRVNGKKMSKSLGNYVTVRDAVQEHDPQVIRFMFATNPFYRPIDYSENSVKEAATELARIQNFLDNLQFLLENASDGKTPDEEKVSIDSYRQKFIGAMDDNFNTASAKAVIFDLVRDLNKLYTEDKLHNKEVLEEVLVLFNEFEQVLGVAFKPEAQEEVPEEVQQLLEEREEARKSKHWKKADNIRAKLKQKGYLVDDTPEGPLIKKA